MRSLMFLLLLVFALTARADFTPTTDFTDNGDGTVTHRLTGLTWMRCPMGQTWTGSACTGTGTTYTWDQATSITHTYAGNSDWRLPSAWELVTIRDFDVAEAINTTVFPYSPGSWSYFWSSTRFAAPSSPDHALVVHFYSGTAITFFETIGEGGGTTGTRRAA